jgi:hypothetical protein
MAGKPLKYNVHQLTDFYEQPRYEQLQALRQLSLPFAEPLETP